MRLARGPVYVVGGALRDARLGCPIRDLDLACAGPRALAQALARELGGTCVTLDAAAGVYRVALKAPLDGLAQVDLARLQGTGIAEDLARRDFTVNALALAPDGTLLDPRGGLKDLESRVLRCEDGRLLRADPLRLLRAFRIAATLGLRIEPGTLRLIRANCRLVSKPAGERVRQELLSLLSASPAHPWLRLMDKAGVLGRLFTDLEACRRCAVEYYGPGGVLRHTLDAVERLDLLLADLDGLLGELAGPLRAHFLPLGGLDAQAPLLRLAVLLHDCAKPAAARRVDGRLRFFGHDALGARKAEALLKRLRFSRAEIQTVSTCVAQHLRPGNLAANAGVSDKAAFRFFRDLGPHGPGLLLACWADHASYLRGPGLRAALRLWRHELDAPPGARVGAATLKTLRHLQVVHLLLKSFLLRRERVRPTRLLDGDAVMRLLRLKPGPRVGEALRRLEEAQGAGEVQDRAGAEAFLRKLRLKVPVFERGPRPKKL